MRSYKQYCALAKALDIIGDRWTLLIIRELLLQGPCRYTDLQRGLPGVATNLLAERLEELKVAGLVKGEVAPPPIATTLYQLTPRGRELEPVLVAMGRWGAPLLAVASRNDVLRTHWLAMPIRHLLADHRPHLPPATIEIRIGDEPIVIELDSGRLTTRNRSVQNPDLVLTGPHQAVLGALAGKLDLATATAAGLQYEGNIQLLERLRPQAVPNY